MGVDWGRFSSPKKRFDMKNNKIFALAAVALVSVALCAVAVAQDQATAQEVVKKVREAASTLSKTSDVAQFNEKQGPWVWKDTYEQTTTLKCRIRIEEEGVPSRVATELCD